MKKIGILGGSFDPVHNGHIELATKALISYGLDFVFLMPAKKNPFKAEKEITEDNIRLDMIKLVLKDRPYLCLLDKELKGEGLSYTYDTMIELVSEFDQCKIYFILGLDSFLSLENWYKGPELLKMVSFIVSIRPGYNKDKLEMTKDRYEKLYGADILIVEDAMPDVSSTKIRKLAAEGKPLDGLVPAEVERYIKENEVYKGSNR
ncbi:MAG: nicotinate-nucleotide adenylyltransferase [Clostridia bacterium]|nr:nicotinate-nucleotide adenylyltransferase [Clostridia bacterium]